MSKKSFIDSVEVGSPCSEKWEKMHGNDRVRFCSHCAKDVKNLSSMTRKEATRIVRASGGDICIRYIKDPVTNRPVFAGQLFQITRRAPGIAAGVMTASLSLSTLTYAQGGTAATIPTQAAASSDSQALNGGKTERSSKPLSTTISGTVLDPNGAVIPNASVMITSSQKSDTRTVTSNDDGKYRFDDLTPGSYLIQTEAAGFGRHIGRLAIDKEGETVFDVSLDIALLEVSVDVIAENGSGSGEGYGYGGVMASVEYATPLHRAVADDDVEKVKDLLIRGEKVDGKDENYNKITPLFIAVENGNVEIARLLLDYGAKVNARDSDKQTPLMRLDDDATPELVKLLVTNGAKIDLTDNEGNTALILAIDGATSEVLKALIDAGADVNAANKEGQTALMNAAERDELESVRVLIMANAKINAKNKEGDTAIDLASEPEIEKLLISYGAHRHPDN